jgi:hypothetical protein
MHVAAVTIHPIAQLAGRRIGAIFDRFFHREGFESVAQIVKLFRLLHSNFFADKTATRWSKDAYPSCTRRVNVSRIGVRLTPRRSLSSWRCNFCPGMISLQRIRSFI